MAKPIRRGYKTVQGRKLRATKVDSCGRPIYGDSSQVVSRGFVSVSYTANTVDTDEINVPGADGQPGVYVASTPQFTGYAVEMEFFEVDPDLFSLITGQPVYLDADGNPIGLRIGTKVSLANQAFALEVWAGTQGTDACVDPNAQGVFGYFLMPFLKGGVLGDLTVENGSINFTITGANTVDGNAWGSGPYNVMMGNNGTSEVQRLTLTGTATGGTFTLSYGGQTTAAIPYNATAAVVQAALDALTSVVEGDIAVTGGPLSTTFFTFTFQGTQAGRDVSQISAVSSLTGSSPALAVTTQTAGVNRTPGPLITPLDTSDHFLPIWVTVAPPDSFYGARPVMDRSSVALTNVAAAKGDTANEANFTFTGPTTQPVYIDFGDGTWDYISAASSGASHVYDANGTYTVRATSNGTVKTTTVTVPIP